MYIHRYISGMHNSILLSDRIDVCIRVYMHVYYAKYVVYAEYMRIICGLYTNYYFGTIHDT